MPSRPTLSIVTINKNNSKGLAKTLRSFRGLVDISDIEFVFVDGQSSDNSIETALQFYAPGHVFCGRDSGIYDAMNKGLEIASAPCIMWVNSGDEIIPSAFSIVLDRIRSMTVDVIAFSALICDESRPGSSCMHLAHESLMPLRWLAHPAVIYSRSAILRIGGYSSVYRITADHESLLALWKAGASFEYSSLPIARFYVGGVSSHWTAEIEREKLNYDYGLVAESDVYRRCRRWLGPLKSFALSAYVVSTSFLRRKKISKRMKAFLSQRIA